MKFPAFKPIKLTVDAPLFEVLEIEVKNILPDVNQPRKNFDIEALNELAASIKAHGIIQPIIVNKIADEDLYQIIAGERRWRAAQIAGLTTIACIIREFKSTEQLAIALIENIQREDLNPLEEAEAIQSLIEECGFTHKEVAETLGKSRTAVSNLLRLLQLEDNVKHFVNTKKLEMGHARALLRTKGDLQITTALQIISQQLSVRQAEKLVQRLDHSDKYQNKLLRQKEKFLIDWCETLEKYLSLKVNFEYTSNEKGRVIIYFKNKAEAKHLVDKISPIIEN